MSDKCPVCGTEVYLRRYSNSIVQHETATDLQHGKNGIRCLRTQVSSLQAVVDRLKHHPMTSDGVPMVLEGEYFRNSDGKAEGSIVKNLVWNRSDKEFNARSADGGYLEPEYYFSTPEAALAAAEAAANPQSDEADNG